VVDGWPEHFSEPPGPVDVNGERWTVRIERAGAPLARPATSTGPPAAAAAAAPDAGGIAVVPPMPGKVIEVRVAEGARVRKGDVLLVLEAMKMRNEIASPADGVVRSIRVRAGTSARAKEPMLFVEPARP
jgi:glutaconyl-CoA/methylmalonyl-CoA decarboxylase subunit gamma